MKIFWQYCIARVQCAERHLALIACRCVRRPRTSLRKCRRRNRSFQLTKARRSSRSRPAVIVDSCMASHGFRNQLPAVRLVRAGARRERMRAFFLGVQALQSWHVVLRARARLYLSFLPMTLRLRGVHCSAGTVSRDQSQLDFSTFERKLAQLRSSQKATPRPWRALLQAALQTDTAELGACVLRGMSCRNVHCLRSSLRSRQSPRCIGS